MNQRSLFETSSHDGVQAIKSPPKSRRSDPETSAKAAAEVDIERAKEALLTGFRCFAAKGATAKEAAAAGMELRAHDIETVRKRVYDLIADGLVVKTAEKKKCVISGKKATVYVLKVHRESFQGLQNTERRNS